MPKLYLDNLADARNVPLLRLARELWREDGALPDHHDEYIERARSLIAANMGGPAAVKAVRCAIRDPELRPRGQSADAFGGNGALTTIDDSEGEEET